MSDKARVSVGYTRSDLEHYRTWESPLLVGADIAAKDGCGNLIQVFIREGAIGFRIKLNGETIREGALR